MPSEQSRILEAYLRRFRRPATASAEAVARALASPKPDPEPPARLVARHRVERRTLDGFDCFRVAPATGVPHQAVLYIFGGAFISQITRPHWDFIGRLVEDLGCEVEVPIYGLPPHHGAAEGLGLVTSVYRELVAAHDPFGVAIAGDSSGGGLALVLAQSLAGQGLPQPGAIVLLSPWLDLTLANPAIADVEPLDPWLCRAGLVEAGRRWAGGDDPASPRTSPVNGPLAGLAPIHVFVGTHDIFVADARRLRALAEEAGTPIHHVEYEGMFHAWVLTPIPEAQEAIAQVVAVLGNLARRLGTCD